MYIFLKNIINKSINKTKKNLLKKYSNFSINNK